MNCWHLTLTYHAVIIVMAATFDFTTSQLLILLKLHFF